MKNSMLIHRIALWLDRKYFSRNTVSAAARSAPKASEFFPYRWIASSVTAPTPRLKPRSEGHSHTSPISEGTAPIRIQVS